MAARVRGGARAPSGVKRIDLEDVARHQRREPEARRCQQAHGRKRMSGSSGWDRVSRRASRLPRSDLSALLVRGAHLNRADGSHAHGSHGRPARATEGVGEPGEDRRPADLRPQRAGSACVLLPGARRPCRYSDAVRRHASCQSVGPQRVRRARTVKVILGVADALRRRLEPAWPPATARAVRSRCRDSERRDVGLAGLCDAAFDIR